ncbi:MAG: bifunctional 2-polyprenyl-6-hydroxyphenol methylase/3-demethylubiquinol 3-O-methyltransferase UbiG [Thermodesulfobacteriota bacterium]
MSQASEDSRNLGVNIDHREIARFESQADQWWNLEGPCRSLHAINPLRAGYIAARAGVAGKSVLDVGCGGGILTEALARMGARMTGIDMGEKPVDAAIRHAAACGLSIRYERMSPEQLALQVPASFDGVVCMELLEHVPDPLAVIQSCAVLVRPGGDVFFSTLNKTFKSFVFAILGAEYILRLLPKHSHDWRRFIRPEDLVAWARAVGLAPLHATGLHYNPFRRTYSLGGDLQVNYMMHFRREPESHIPVG